MALSNVKEDLLCNGLIRVMGVSLMLLTGLFFSLVPAQNVLASGTTYYIDCSASNNGDGSQSNPWNSLSSVNSHGSFQGGDQILFNRGTTCTGMLTPSGSGYSGATITLGAYGYGALPVIDGGNSSAALQLTDQQYWDISDLELEGGNPHTVFITGTNQSSATTLTHIHLSNLSVHDVNGSLSSSSPYCTGLINICAGQQESWNDILIDGSTLYNGTNEWFGIVIVSGDANSSVTNSTVQNTTIHDTGGDAIVLDYGQNTTIQYNTAYNTGSATQKSSHVGTPDSIWQFGCKGNCVTQSNEAYNSHNGINNWDAGLFDSDFDSTGQIIQYNYGHDSDGYCIVALSSNGHVTSNAIIRYNICANNEQGDSGNQYGAIVVLSFDNGHGNGSVDGVQIYNNTIYWNPQANVPVFQASNAVYSGSNPDVFENNLIYSTSNTTMINAPGVWSLNNNLYWQSSGTPQWTYDGTTYSSLGSYQSGSGQDSNGVNADPLLVNAVNAGAGRSNAITDYSLQSGSPAISLGASISGNGGRDFAGNSVPSSGAVECGALQ